MGKRIVIIITGSIAASKTLDLIRQLRHEEWNVRCVLTPAARHFVTPASIAALTGEAPLDQLFADSSNDTHGSNDGDGLNDGGGSNDGFEHIRLSRQTDILAVVPASADFLARMACGLAQDLAGAVVLARDKPLIAAPAMNVRMWENPATQRNIAMLRRDGVIFVEPEEGILACGEHGAGRMAEPDIIARVIARMITQKPQPMHSSSFLASDSLASSFLASGSLAGKSALVTSGATIESLDPVRYIANRSSGRQGHAIAQALQAHGAKTVLVSGSSTIADPSDVTTIHVEDAQAMHQACMEHLPCDIAVCAAAVADWRPERRHTDKIETTKDHPPTLNLTANPDILAAIAHADNRRPSLVVGFSAETSSNLDRARRKMKSKGCDWMIHNDVSGGKSMGTHDNQVTILDSQGHESWPLLDKSIVADRLAERIARHFTNEAKA